MKRSYYSASFSEFKKSTLNEILGALVTNSEFSLEERQREAWIQEIQFLKDALKDYEGAIFFEYAIPRMGRRIDVVLIISHVIFVLEFKIGESKFLYSAIDQVWDYALDLKNFHEESRKSLIAPILIASRAKSNRIEIDNVTHNDNVLKPIRSNFESFIGIINEVLKIHSGETIDYNSWINGRYSPTPTIIEAARALYNNHSVADISRNDALAVNLSRTSDTILALIEEAKIERRKVICFVTGVPGAGKTLVGLDISTKHMNMDERTSSVYLSGNGPLVAVLREALTRDKIEREKAKGMKAKKGEVFGAVKSIIQNIHHFRDEYLKDSSAPFDHVAIFDEAQRAWNHTQTADFMKRKKNRPDFMYSEPEFLISCLDRHKDWAVIICLVGGGQEINKGEAGISEWIDSLNRSFNDWQVYISSNLSDSEYGSGYAIKKFQGRKNVFEKEELHLAVSMRSFRAEHLSTLVKNLLDFNIIESRENLNLIRNNYPIFLTRDIHLAKQWLKIQARGTERYGIIVSSQAQRLKPYAIDVKSPMNPVHWFLNEKNDIRSSYYLEDVATEFHVQGLELDWSCVVWDGDFRYSEHGWQHYSFSGNKWKNINSVDRKRYLKNAYRVLLTRARQGMVIVVPFGDREDNSRLPEYYDSTFEYLSSIGLKVLE